MIESLTPQQESLIEVYVKKYLQVTKDTKLSHGRGASSEHATKVLPKGIYTFESQSEFDWVKNIKREVID